MADFSTLDEFRALLNAAHVSDSDAVTAAANRNAQLTKPPGALGRLEDLAIWYAGWRGTDRPEVKAPQVIVFAGNHGVAARGVSAFPPEVTEQMVLNFQHGGAAVNQLAKSVGATLDVHALKLDAPTKDFTQAPAMTGEELVSALKEGWTAVSDTADVLVVGEMGIGNTTSAAALAAACLGGTPEDWVGRGTGVDDAGLALKAQVLRDGLALLADRPDGIEILRCLGGREIAAMAGAIARARVLHLPVILDGFICCAAAICLHRDAPNALDHCVAGHLSAESGHAKLLAAMDKQPLLSLDMRLGEASGGTLAISVLKAAVVCLSDMATFAEAGVSGSA
ncbi:MAG: nicotinate-nucleotide--dimethylbenzimidazole phosphoribosyltransferase [Pseudomonadota bacterium]